MRHGRWIAALAVVLLWLVGCAATGPKGSEMATSLGAVPAGYGRIVFFRSDSFVGGGVRPQITLDGQAVGQSVPGGFFYVDASPGKHTASASTEATAQLDIQVVAGQTHYVRSAIGMGLLVGRVAFTVEGSVTAREELPSLSYTGSTPVRIGAPGAAGGSVAAVAAPAAPEKAPDLKRGDQLVYRITDKLTGLTREVTYAVDRIDAERISFNQGGRVESRSGSVLTANTPLAGVMELCLPPGGWTRPDMVLGMSWSADFQRPPGGSCAGGSRLQSRVVSEERLPTALGELLVQRVDIEGDLQRTERYTYQTRVKARAFYAPQLARVVRFESELRAAHGPPELELVELIEVRRD